MRFRYLGLRPVDGLFVSYPKSGSTWLRFLLAHALTARESDFDAIRETIPPVGRHRRSPGLLSTGGRLVRTHEPLRPFYGRRGQPVVYLVRDGHDVALSYLEHERRYGRFDGDLAEFLELFVSGRVDGYGTWHGHVSAALDFAATTPGPFLLVRYEDLRADPPRQLRRVLDFLGADADGVDLDDVVASNSKERMRVKERSSAFLSAQATDGSPFVRSDRRQGWAELVPLHLQQRFDRVCGAALAAAGYPVGADRGVERQEKQ